MGGSCSQNEERQDAFKILTGNPTEKRPLEMPRRRCEDRIKMYLKEIVTIRRIGLIRRRGGIIEPFL